jgi:quercetin dioxygenase-like cupin family protein
MKSTPQPLASRRKCLATLAALVPMPSGRGALAGARPARPQTAGAQPGPALAKPRLVSKVYPFGELKESKSGGNSFWSILKGETWAGCPIEVHESRLAPGASPHPPHHHAHEEMFLVREGEVEVTIAGHSTRLGAGSAAYVASNDQHGIRNVGEAAALYFVLAIGSQ